MAEYPTGTDLITWIGAGAISTAGQAHADTVMAAAVTWFTENAAPDSLPQAGDPEYPCNEIMEGVIILHAVKRLLRRSSGDNQIALGDGVYTIRGKDVDKEEDVALFFWPEPF